MGVLAGGSTSFITRILLIRHGHVIAPAADCLYGGMDVPLSDLGRQQAVAAAFEAKSLPISHVFSSPLSRAMFGAERVLEAQPRRPALTIERDLREVDRGAWGGRPRAEIESEFPGGLARLKDDEDFSPPDGESMRQLRGRVLRAYERILQRTPRGEAVAIVSHMHVTRAIVSHILGTQPEDIEIPLASSSLISIDHSTGLASMVFIGKEPDLSMAGGSRNAAGNAWGG